MVLPNLPTTMRITVFINPRIKHVRVVDHDDHGG